MGTMNIEQGIHWPRGEPGYRNDNQNFREELVEQSLSEQTKLIGQWYYYLHLHDRQIDLCRTRGKVGFSPLAEVVKPGELAISDDDLEYAVRHQSCGSFEAGYYGISPHIERKLRILFE